MLTKTLIDKVSARNNAKKYVIVRVGYRTHVFECMNEAVDFAIASYNSSDEPVDIELHDETEFQPEEESE